MVAGLDEDRPPGGAAVKSGTAWTSQDDELLMRCAKTGKTLDYTAKALGRTRCAVLARFENFVSSELRWRELCITARKTEVSR